MTTLPPDPVIDEIREVPHQISARFGHDPKRLVDHYIKIQRKHEERLVRSPETPGKPVAEAVAETE